MKKVIEIVLIAMPWLLLLWLIEKAFEGEINGFVAFILVVLLIPLIFIINTVTIIALRGQVVIKQMRNAQKTAKEGNKPLKSTNYADLPWWNPKRWR